MNHRRFIAGESELLSESPRGMGWDLHYDQLKRGRFTNAVNNAGTPQTQFFHERYNRAVCIHSAAPAGW